MRISRASRNTEPCTGALEVEYKLLTERSRTAEYDASLLVALFVRQNVVPVIGFTAHHDRLARAADSGTTGIRVLYARSPHGGEDRLLRTHFEGHIGALEANRKLFLRHDALVGSEHGEVDDAAGEDELHDEDQAQEIHRERARLHGGPARAVGLLATTYAKTCNYY